MVSITNTSGMNGMYLSYLIYGLSKTGKTRLAASIPSNELMFINIEDNVVSLYGADVNKVDCKSFDDVVAVIDWVDTLPVDSRPKWLFMDSVSELSYRLLVEETPKHKNGMQAYGEVAFKIKELIRRINDMDLNFVCIAQCGKVKDEVTGGLVYGITTEGQKLITDLPYMFDALIATRAAKNDEGVDFYMLQCKACSQYSAGVRLKYNNEVNLETFEPQDLIALHNKILGV